jgi:hypothetical protein
MTIYRSGVKTKVAPVKLTNPWRLTLGEVDVMDAILVADDVQDAAAKLRIALPTMRSHTSGVRKKMGVASTIRAAVLWDRWRQGEGKGVPA